MDCTHKNIPRVVLTLQLRKRFSELQDDVACRPLESKWEEKYVKSQQKTIEAKSKSTPKASQGLLDI